ncbi:MAG: hypothetical protein DRN57_06260 [Thermoplasmata archaeon]|nr:MAG: hypothetical protein DRN57_06260 [Thermoplasmata archaeon]
MITILMIVQATILFIPGLGQVRGSDYGDQNEWILVGRDEYLSIEGSSVSQGLGESAVSGDIDGDGRDDIILGAPSYSGEGGAGAVIVFFSRDPDEVFPMTAPYDADLVIYGVDADDHFGTALVTADINMDGFEDIVISAPDADGKGNAKRNSGEVYILAGRARSEYPSRMWIARETLFGHIYGRDAVDRLGVRLAAGDLTGDGRNDLVIGSMGAGGFGVETPYENQAPGSWELEIVEGSSSPIGDLELGKDQDMVRYFSSLNVSDMHAMSIGTGLEVSDVNADGYDDLLFSFSRWRSLRPLSSEVSIISGGPSFPYASYNSSVDVIIPSYSPNMTIQMNSTALEPPVIECGDLDGDPYLDILLGNPALDSFERSRLRTGQVMLLGGRDFTSGDVIYLDQLLTTIYGEDSSDGFGSSISCVDMDGDGMDEIYIGAPMADGYMNLYTGCGEGYLFDLEGTFPAHLNVTDSAMRFMGRSQAMASFSSIASVHMNDDVIPELIVTSPGYRDEEGGTIGMVSVFMERQEFRSRFFGSATSSIFGRRTLISDFNRDGYNDVVISDPYAGYPSTGAAYLFFGDASGWDGMYESDSDADIEYTSSIEPEQSAFGSSLAAGDLDHDGYTDLVVGAPENYDGFQNPGSVHIFWGGTKGYMAQKNYKRILGQSVEGAGDAVAVGDYNGDGVDDLAVSMTSTLASQSQNRYHAGAVALFFGPISRTPSGIRINSADVRISGAIPNERIGETLEAGDVNGDGYDDLVIGAPRSDLGSITDQGVVYVLAGRSSWGVSYDLLYDPVARIFGPWPYDQIGTSLAVGDIDDDGREEVIIGAPSGDGYQRTTNAGGNVYILKGASFTDLAGGGNLSIRTDVNISIFGDLPGERLGSSLAVGDIDGDGTSDLVMGAVGWGDGISTSRPGAALILLSALIRDGSMLNSSSLPVISSRNDGDQAGYSLYAGNLTGDAREDLIMSSPGYDAGVGLGKVGGVFLWEAGPLEYTDIGISPVRIIGSHQMIPLMDYGEVPFLSPMSGPYIFRVSGRSIGGYQDISTISISMDSLEGAGGALFLFDTASGSFSSQTSGIFSGSVMMDAVNCSGSSDGVQSWMVDFALYLGWSMPPVDRIVSHITGSSGEDHNYLSTIFRVDNTITLETDSVDVKLLGDSQIWVNANSLLAVENITLMHSINGETIEGAALEGISLALVRPDGIPVQISWRNGSTLQLNATGVGGGISGENVMFSIGPSPSDPLPQGALWSGNYTFEMPVDTDPPLEVTSFLVYTDGLESGTSDLDDDRLVWVSWSGVSDMGPSLIDRCFLEIWGGDGMLKNVIDPIDRYDAVILPEDRCTLKLYAVDRAGNIGPPAVRSVISDLDAPIFFDPSPSPDCWLDTMEGELKVKVIDRGSGLDPETAMYRIYDPRSDILSEWMDVLGTEQMEGGAVRLAAEVPDREGYGQYIQWKVSDNVGQTSISAPYSFHIDTTMPVLDIGEGEVIIGPEPYTMECFMEDELSWLNLSTVEFRFDSASLFPESNWYRIGWDGLRVSASATIEVDPDFRGFGYAQWRVRDRAGNLAESDIIRVMVDRELPVFTDFEPNESLIMTEKEIEVTIHVVDAQSGIDPGDIEISVSTLSGWVRYGVGGYSPWKKVDELEVSGSDHIATSKVELDEGMFNLVKFRVRDRAGNGWVVSRPHRIIVELPHEDLPPTALFTIRPASDVIFSGDELLLDGTPSMDPEEEMLNYTWYSNLEGYPGTGLLGYGRELNITLTVIGVHELRLVVSDGNNTVESDPVRVRVLPVESSGTSTGEKKRGVADILKDALPYILLFTIIGILVGALISYLILRRRRPVEMPESGPELVDAVYEPDYVVPHCPYCGEEVRPTDEYCIKCGTVFTEKDKHEMLSPRKKKKGKKRKKKDRGKALPPKDEDSNLPVEEDLGDEEEYLAREPVLEEEEVPDIEEAEDMDIEELEEEAFEEVEEELEEIDEEAFEEELPDLEDDIEDWEVDE